MVEVPQLNTIEVGNTLEKAESNLINGLKLEAFDVDAKKENIDEMKEVLKSTTINIITSVAGVVPETKEALSLVDIATQFDKYVEKGEGWKLKAKEKDTDGNPLIIPEWITYIIENPKNNDLAYLVQKIAELVEYQTAKAYTESEVDAVKVWVDKAFGNQTRRALAGLKNRIEDTAPTTIIKWKTYEWKYIAKMFLEWVISSGKTDEEKNTALVKYNLQYKNKEIMPIDWYEFIDPNSNNYAVIKTPTWNTTNQAENPVWEVTVQADVEWGNIETEPIDISKKLDSTMYDKYTDKIEKIKINTFIEKYKTEYPWIEKCFFPIDAKLVTINESNPYFQIRYKNSETLKYNNTQTNKISMRECMDTETFNFDQNMFFEKLLDQLKPIIETNNMAEKNKEILKWVRWKKFSKSDLFGNTHDNDARYTTYFEAFDNNKVEIDSSEEYTKITWDNLNFRLDDSGLDKDYNKDKSIPINTIINEQWILDNEKLKKELATIISNIIDTDLS